MSDIDQRYVALVNTVETAIAECLLPLQGVGLSAISIVVEWPFNDPCKPILFVDFQRQAEVERLMGEGVDRDDATWHPAPVANQRSR